IVGALALSRVLGSLLYGVGPHDPLVLGTVAAVLLATGALACAVPALHASRRSRRCVTTDRCVAGASRASARTAAARRARSRRSGCRGSMPSRWRRRGVARRAA